MKILVTGGAGFIGSNFIRHALHLKRDYHIVNYDCLTYAGNLANLVSAAENPNYTFVRGNICDGESVRHAMRGCDAVIHFAAESHVDQSISRPAPFIETNVVGTFTLLEAAKTLGIPRFVQISTDEVYGDIAADCFAKEESPIRPSSPYAASKAAADLLVRSYVRTYGFPAIITRSSNNYGPFQYPEKFLPVAITAAQQNKPLPIYGDGRQQRNWLFVEDNCRAIIAVLERGRLGDVYNVGGDGSEENLVVARKLLKLMGKPETWLVHVDDRPGHDRRYALQSQKIRTELGWSPQVALEDGLCRTIDWYQANTAWLAEVKVRIEPVTNPARRNS